MPIDKVTGLPVNHHRPEGTRIAVAMQQIAAESDELFSVANSLNATKNPYLLDIATCLYTVINKISHAVSDFNMDITSASIRHNVIGKQN